jgi:hypothetical protein
MRPGTPKPKYVRPNPSHHGGPRQLVANATMANKGHEIDLREPRE